MTKLKRPRIKQNGVAVNHIVNSVIPSDRFNQKQCMAQIHKTLDKT